MSRAEKAIHEVEIYIGILIGAVTFSGSVIAFGKLSGKIGGKPLLLPARHWLNLAGLLVVIGFGYELLQSPDIAAGLTALTVMTVIAPSWTAFSTWKPGGTKAAGCRLRGMALIPS